MRKLLLLLLLPVSLFAQHIAIVNFSQGANGTTLSNGTDGGATGTIAKSWYGTYGGSANGCSGQVPCVSVQNSSGALTFSNNSVCGSIPSFTGSNIVLDYSTTLGNGVGNQLVHMQFPTPPSTVTIGQFVVLFCSNYPSNGTAFGTTGDMIQVVSPNNQISNYNCNGTNCWFALEHGVLAGTHPMPYTPGTWVQLSFQYIAGGTCADTTNFTDCQRMGEFDLNGNQIGTYDYGSGGNAPTPSEITLGNGNAASMSAGFHVQFGAVKMSLFGATVGQFPLLFSPAPPSEGIIARNRTIDWTKAGISQAVNQGTLPSSAWAQCGSPVAAGTSAATIQTLLNGCAANTYLLLGSGTFNLSTNIVFPTGGNVEVRGSGANSTFLIFSGSGGCAGQVSAAFCIDSSDHTNTGTPPTAVNWTAGYAQGSNQITLSSVAGISLNSTMLYLDQCDTGLSGSSTCPTGTNTDNGNLYVCGLAYSAGNGCSFSGPDAGGMRPLRNQLEIHTATAINGSVVTITPPLSMPNWASGQTPQVWIAQPITNVGLTNMSIDLSNASAPTACAETLNAYKIFIRGVRCVNPKSRAFNFFQMASSNVQDNYIYHPTGTLPSNYGFRRSASAYNVVQNNIIQQVTGGSDFQDGASVGDVSAYNLVLAADSGGNIGNPIDGHSGNFFGLTEGAVGIQDSCDNTHGTCGMRTRFRNFFAGWTSNPASPVGTFNRSIDDYAYSRYSANIAGVYGTPGNTTIYSSTGSNGSNFSNGRGGGGPAVPNDALSASTSLKWANWDNVTAGCTTVSACSTATFRTCGNSLDTGWASPCGSTTESPIGASIFPNTVPVIGDTAIGQPGLPASLYLTAKPLWFQSISWPAIGPDVTGGNVGQCSGTLNTIGQMAGMPATTGSQCTGTSLLTSWGGHVKAIPALDCYLRVMAGPADGSGAVLPFDAGACYGGTAAPVATFSPANTNMGQVPSGLTSNLSPVVTLTNTGTANLVVSTISLGSAVFSMVNNICGSPATITNTIPGTGFTLTPSTSCSFQIRYSPVTPNFSDTTSIFFSPGASNPDVYSLSGISTGPPAPAVTIFARRN